MNWKDLFLFSIGTITFVSFEYFIEANPLGYESEFHFLTSFTLITTCLSIVGVQGTKVKTNKDVYTSGILGTIILIIPTVLLGSGILHNYLEFWLFVYCTFIWSLLVILNVFNGFEEYENKFIYVGTGVSLFITLFVYSGNSPLFSFSKNSRWCHPSLKVN